MKISKMLSPKQTLMTLSMLDMFSIGLIMPHMDTHIHQLGASHILLGVMGALSSASQFISGPPAGSLSDSKGRKPILMLCLSVCGFCYLSLGFITSIYILLIIRIILGLTNHTSMLSEAICPDYVKDKNEQSTLFGKMASLSGIGMAVGTMLGGHVIEAFPVYGFTVITTIIAAAFAVNFSLIRNLPEVKNKNKEDKTINTKAALNLIESIKGHLKQTIDKFHKIDWMIFGDLFLLKLIIMTGMMMCFGNFGLFLMNEHSVSPKNLGYVFSFQSVIGALSSYFIGFINKLYKNDVNGTLRLSHVYLIVTFTIVGFACAPNLSTFVSLLIPFATALSVERIVSLEILMGKCTEDNRGTVMGASGSIMALSGVVTPLIAGFINQYIGVVYVFFIAAIFTGYGVVISNRLRSKSLATKDK